MPQTFIVSEGNTLQHFAVRLGSVRWWPTVWLHNLDKVIDPDLIFPGQEIVVPDEDDYQRLVADCAAAGKLLFSPDYRRKIDEYRRSLGYRKVLTSYGYEHGLNYYEWKHNSEFH